MAKIFAIHFMPNIYIFYCQDVGGEFQMYEHTATLNKVNLKKYLSL